MLSTYRAILRGNQIEWSGDAPNGDLRERPVAVHVTILDESLQPSETADKGARMAAALEQLATASALAEIDDPSKWQREQRIDRSLPGRES
jgi:hypothetical protein